MAEATCVYQQLALLITPLWKDLHVKALNTKKMLDDVCHHEAPPGSQVSYFHIFSILCSIPKQHALCGEVIHHQAEILDAARTARSSSRSRACSSGCRHEEAQAAHARAKVPCFFVLVIVLLLLLLLVVVVLFCSTPLIDSLHLGDPLSLENAPARPCFLLHIGLFMITLKGCCFFGVFSVVWEQVVGWEG